MSDYTSDYGESSGDANEEIVAKVAAFWKPATQMRSRHRRSITLHITDNRRVSFPASTFDSARILRHYLVAGVDSMEWVNVKELMLIPKTIREVERAVLFLCRKLHCGPLPIVSLSYESPLFSLHARRVKMRHFVC